MYIRTAQIILLANRVFSFISISGLSTATVLETVGALVVSSISEFTVVQSPATKSCLCLQVCYLL